MAAGLATLEVYEEQKIFENALAMSSYWEEGLHSLKGLPHVVDIRNHGLLGAVEMTPYAATAPVKRSMDVFDRCFDHGLFMRVTGPAVALSPPLICEKKHIDRIIDILARSIKESAAQL